MRKRSPGSSGRRAGGAITVEFALILMGSLAFFGPVGEFYRLSLIDQTLARATHLGARAAGADPGLCQSAVAAAFNADLMALWLLDTNDDGTIGVALMDDLSWPDGSPAEEVAITVAVDEDLFDGGDWATTAGCGTSGSWIELRARIVVQPWFGLLRTLWPDGIRRQRESWARNQA